MCFLLRQKFPTNNAFAPESGVLLNRSPMPADLTPGASNAASDAEPRPQVQR
jgi:hypothetical protein